LADEIYYPTKNFKMKKSIFCIAMSLLLMTISPLSLRAGTEARPVSMVLTESQESAEATVLLTRLHEINTMDKSDLSSSEKKQLRKEVRSIKHELNELGGGVYISVGAIIIIILLLILLL
jgi:hypothetical protein